MHLRRLDIVGFKSFAARTATEMMPGIVVVVGPNGSGKSNIADAVRWVLGEQSAKAVRARKPEEVIFAGSATRQPLGMAEVSLVLDNSDGSLPIDYAEVRVTRRLFRSGDSEYLLNGARVRLRDITQLLLHAGLSPDSYSVIGQGSIDELILQRPDERRVAFENVADIRRHQLRLNDTRSKLNGTEANLVRVQDVLAELTPHVKRLKSQADRAARAETFLGELHELLVRTYRVRLSRAHALRRAADAALQQATLATETAEGSSQATEQELSTVDGRIAALDERFAALRPRAEGLREQARAAERALAVAREREAGLGEQRRVLEIELERLQVSLERLGRDEAEAARAAGESDPNVAPEETAELDLARVDLAARTTELETAQADRAAAFAAFDALERRISEAEGSLARTEQQLQTLQANLAVDEARRTDRTARVTALEATVAQRSTDASALQAEVAAAREAQTTALARQRVAVGRLDEAREALRTTSRQADRLQGALAALGAANVRRADAPDVPADWRAALVGLPVVGVAGTLARQVRPIDLLLHGFLQRIVVIAGDDAAREAHRRLSAHLADSAPAWAVLSMDGLLLAADGARPLEAAADAGQSALADWARQVRQLEEELTAAESQRSQAEALLATVRGQVEETEAAERAARIASGELEVRLTEVRRAESGARAELQHLQGEQERAQRAAQQRTDEQARATRRSETTRAELEAARTERAALTDTLRGLEDQVVAVTERASAARAALAGLEAAAGRRAAEREARAALHARVKAEVAGAATARLAATARRSQLDTQQTELAAEAVRLGTELATFQRQLEPLEAELNAAAQARLDVVAERQAVEQRLTALRAAERTAHEQREQRHVNAQRATDELERLQAEITETAELDAETAGGAAWAEQLRLQFDGEVSTDEAFDLDAARRRIATLQRELRAVGGVADSVVDEYREMSERHTFLEQQSADLQAAMADLRGAAEELEAHMRERFSAAFEATQAAFQETFVELFGGGEARLVLTDPDDLLRTGVDIVARPPGKKLQGLLSLSGGERALTVVALMLGLLKINPTPFCVLDEVDAALDEANVQRFANLLVDFARQIQFIVVTHNRATMDKADALYGVSMDAAGISHIFSVQPRAMAAAGRTAPS